MNHIVNQVLLESSLVWGNVNSSAADSLKRKLLCLKVYFLHTDVGVDSCHVCKRLLIDIGNLLNS